MKRVLVLSCLLALATSCASRPPPAAQPAPAAAPQAAAPAAPSEQAPASSAEATKQPVLPWLENSKPSGTLSPGGKPPPGQSEEPAGPSLAWHTALEGDAVVVELVDATSHYRVEKVELLGPAGERIAADQLTRQVEHRYGYSTDYPPGPFSIGVAGGSSSGVGLAIGANVPLGIHDSNALPRTTTRARIALSDPGAYRANAQAWKISAQLIDSKGDTSFIEIPAPMP